MTTREFWAAQADLIRDTTDLFAIVDSKSPKERAAALVDTEGYPIGWLQARVTTVSKLALPAGLKIIKLERNPKNDKQRRCVFWWKGAYHEEYLDDKVITNVHYSKLTSDAAIVFQNDAEHLLHRLQDKKGKQKEFDVLIKNIENFVNMKDFTYNALLLKLIAIEEKLRFDPSKIGESIDRLAKAIFEVYDPERTYGGKNLNKFSDIAFVLPLTINWFKNQDNRNKRYTEPFFKKQISKELSGRSGQASVGDDYIDLSKQLIALKTELSSLEPSKDKEWVWLTNLTDDYLQSHKKIVLIHDETVLNMSDIFAQSIVLENSISIFRLSNILSVIMHELTQTDYDYLGYGDSQSLASCNNPANPGYSTDGHTPKDDVITVWIKVQTERTQLSNLVSNNDLMDFLLMNRRAYLAISLNIILNEIKK